MRLTARARLTLLLIGLVLAAGTVLAALTYLLMRQNLRHRSFFLEVDPSGGATPPPSTPLRDQSERVVADTLSALAVQAGLALVVVTALAALLGWLVAGRVLRPIRAISSTARRLSAENLTERVPVTAPADELSVLAGTVNDMLDRIQRGVAEREQILGSQRLFTANAAHELRTPLTTARTAIDVTLDGEPDRAELLTMAGDVRSAVEHVQRILDGLLLLARSQAGIGAAEPADLADLAAGALEDAKDRARGLDLRTDLQPAPVSGEPILLERMIGNLVDNAIRYNRPGGQLTVTTGTADGLAVLRVVNTGRCIPPDQAQTLLEPFVHGYGARVHTDRLGLGLSIVQAVALAHRGRIQVTAPDGGGLDVTVHLPLSSLGRPTVL
ncbi:sensor histidine kinase [Cryptosporangium aurantiacum]|uniref:histidine kinase n=1 Tax=Cryptosporangium aurantiacum TaxID=134849 RepID=A0A1M7QFT4_9ACTN|nr:HAMP domain-containing sensor histidine kinase [Cryptosporangium aurantiacum]SHN29913.1 Signal transduction histidine kinase [Cryptosporangium aurantiacum]